MALSNITTLWFTKELDLLRDMKHEGAQGSREYELHGGISY